METTSQVALTTTPTLSPPRQTLGGAAGVSFNILTETGDGDPLTTETGERLVTEDAP